MTILRNAFVTFLMLTVAVSARRKRPESVRLLHKQSGEKLAAKKDVHGVKFGRIKVSVVSDGTANPSSEIFSTFKEELVRSYERNGRSADPIRTSQNVIVLDIPSGRFIVDTGSFFTPELGNLTASSGLLFENLKKASITRRSIDGVLLTHGHPDHVGGLVNSKLEPMFPNSIVYIGEKEHDFWFADPVPPVEGIRDEILTLLGNIYKRSVQPYMNLGQFVLVPDNKSPVRGVKFVPTPGHTPGHNSIYVTEGRHRLIIVGDAWASEADQLQNPDWTFYLDTNPFEGYKSRIALLEEAQKSKDLVAVFHEQFPGLGRVGQLGPFFKWREQR